MKSKAPKNHKCGIRGDRFAFWQNRASSICKQCGDLVFEIEKMVGIEQVNVESILAARNRQRLIAPILAATASRPTTRKGNFMKHADTVDADTMAPKTRAILVAQRFAHLLRLVPRSERPANESRNDRRGWGAPPRRSLIFNLPASR